jgi:hypothetical protein
MTDSELDAQIRRAQRVPRSRRCDECADCRKYIDCAGAGVMAAHEGRRCAYLSSR